MPPDFRQLRERHVFADRFVHGVLTSIAGGGCHAERRLRFKGIKVSVTWLMVQCPRLLPDFPMSVITRSCDQSHNLAIPLESDFHRRRDPYRFETSAAAVVSCESALLLLVIHLMVNGEPRHRKTITR